VGREGFLQHTASTPRLTMADGEVRMRLGSPASAMDGPPC